MSEREKELIERLINLMFEPLENNPELLKADLAEEGVDYDQVASEGESFVRLLISKQKLVYAKRERENRLSEIGMLLIDLKNKGRDEIIKTLHVLFPNTENEPALQGFFHKLTSAATDEDIEEILQDVEILKLLKEKKG